MAAKRKGLPEAWKLDAPPVGRVMVFRRYGARWAIVLDRSPVEPVTVGEAQRLRGVGEVSVWRPVRGGAPVFSGGDADALNAFLASPAARTAAAAR